MGLSKIYVSGKCLRVKFFGGEMFGTGNTALKEKFNGC